ncbi:hypothetical protein ABZ835_19230 [Streptomyces sp. NPDC047461]|uniref:hypothetical protein n=1 Tax=Streptomyces sp. NPDC047461 TaxID=3155619 RepID=UPI00340DF410
MSTRLAPTVACIGTFVLLTHLTMAGAALSHRTLPLAGLFRIQRVIDDMAPTLAVALPGVCGQAARRGVVAP